MAGQSTTRREFMQQRMTFMMRLPKAGCRPNDPRRRDKQVDAVYSN